MSPKQSNSLCWRLLRAHALAMTDYFLAVKIQDEFVRGWAQTDSIYFIDTLVFDVFLKQVRGEDTTLEQEFMVRFEHIQYFCERTGYLLDLLLLFNGQFIEIAVLRLTWINLVAYAIHTCHKDG